MQSTILKQPPCRDGGGGGNTVISLIELCFKDMQLFIIYYIFP